VELRRLRLRLGLRVSLRLGLGLGLGLSLVCLPCLLRRPRQLSRLRHLGLVRRLNGFACRSGVSSGGLCVVVEGCLVSGGVARRLRRLLLLLMLMLLLPMLLRLRLM